MERWSNGVNGEMNGKEVGCRKNILIYGRKEK